MPSLSPRQIQALRELLIQTKPPLNGGVEEREVHREADVPTRDPSTLPTSLKFVPTDALLDLSQALSLSLAKPQDRAAPVAADVSSSSSSSSWSPTLAIIEVRLLLASCCVVLALMAPSTSASSTASPKDRLNQATTQLDVARGEVRARQMAIKQDKKRLQRVAQGAADAVDETREEDQLTYWQADLLLASANVAYLAGRPEMEVNRLLGWRTKATRQLRERRDAPAGR